MTAIEAIANAVHDLLAAFVVCMFIASVVIWAGVIGGTM